MFFNKIIFLLISFVILCASHEQHEQHQNLDEDNQQLNYHNGGIKTTRSGIKSYGGYFNHGPSHGFVHTRSYQPAIVPSYQPFGWNFNQPSRTYGKLLLLFVEIPNFLSHLFLFFSFYFIQAA